MSNLQSEVENISGAVEGLSRHLGIAVNEIVLNVTQIDLAKPVNRIDSKFDQMISFSRNVPISEDSIKAFANEILHYPNLADDVQYIYSAMVKSTLKIGVLEVLYNILVERIRSAAFDDRGEELLKCYNALHIYFNELVAYQMKAALLIINAYTVEIGLPESNESKAFRERLQSYLNQEVEAFLVLTERLVAATADVRTMMYGDYSMFPKEVEKVFHHADFIAKQLSTKHGAGFIIRVVGDPTNALYLSVPQKGALAGSFVEKSKNLYLATMPSHYPADSNYLGWIKVGNNWKFFSQSKIAINKFTYPAPYTSGSPTRIPTTHTISYSNGAFTATGKFGYVDEDGEPTEANSEGSTLYGNAVLIARRSPKFESVRIKSKNKHGEWDTTFNARGAAAAGNLAMNYVLKDKYRGFALDYPPLPCANSEMAISATLVDGDGKISGLKFNLQTKDYINAWLNYDNFRYAFKARRLFLSYDWRLSMVSPDSSVTHLVKVHDKNYNDLMPLNWTYWKRQTKELPNSGIFSKFEKNKSYGLFFVSDNNMVDIDESFQLYSRDDSGSRAYFSHQITELEIIPQ